MNIAECHEMSFYHYVPVLSFFRPVFGFAIGPWVIQSLIFFTQTALNMGYNSGSGSQKNEPLVAYPYKVFVTIPMMYFVARM